MNIFGVVCSLIGAILCAFMAGMNLVQERKSNCVFYALCSILWAVSLMLNILK